MLSCREVTERSSRYVDAELGTMERLSMRLHLLMCVHCRRFVAQLRCLVAALGQRPAPAAPPETVERLLAQLPLEPDASAPPEPPPERD